MPRTRAERCAPYGSAGRSGDVETMWWMVRSASAHTACNQLADERANSDASFSIADPCDEKGCKARVRHLGRGGRKHMSNILWSNCASDEPDHSQQQMSAKKARLELHPAWARVSLAFAKRCAHGRSSTPDYDVRRDASSLADRTERT